MVGVMRTPHRNLRLASSAATGHSSRVLEAGRDAVHGRQQSVLEVFVFGQTLTPEKLGLNQIDRVEIGTPELERATQCW